MDGAIARQRLLSRINTAKTREQERKEEGPIVRKSTIFLFFLLMVGLALVLYPPISNFWNKLHQSGAISSYNDVLMDMSQEDYEAILNSATEYNQELSPVWTAGYLPPAFENRYYQELSVSGSSVMGYIEIPSINVELPIYHGTSEEVLQIGVGHLEWSSLPIGGESTHCVLSGHRGLPSSRLFTDLDQLTNGDIFILHILDEMVTYEVDQVNIVLPHEMGLIRLEDGEDLCSLVTCTPYGVNSHRMIVKGHRIDSVYANKAKINGNALMIKPIMVAPFIAIPVLITLLIMVLVKGKEDA